MRVGEGEDEALVVGLVLVGGIPGERSISTKVIPISRSDGGEGRSSVVTKPVEVCSSKSISES